MLMQSTFQWDSAKAIANRRKHGIGFPAAVRIFDGPIVEQPDDREEYGEERIVALGMVNGQVLHVVYTWRGEARRIISARKAEAGERRVYGEILARNASA